MEQVTSPDGATISYEVTGSGPPLVLVHGTLTDRNLNWFAVKAALAENFTVYAIDRRGRGLSSATEGHSTRSEFQDAAAVVRAAGEPVFLLGHSYGAQIALGGAALVPDLVRKLVLYEPPVASSLTDEELQALEDDAAREDWDAFAARFLGSVAGTPKAQLDAMQSTPVWKMLAANAKATLQEVRAFKAHDFVPDEFSSLPMPVLFLYGGDSPPVQLVATNELATVVKLARKVALTGQGHQGMVTDPPQFVGKVTSFLLGQ